MEILLELKKKKFYDKLIISKGHATVGVYPILRDFKILSKKDMRICTVTSYQFMEEINQIASVFIQL